MDKFPQIAIGRFSTVVGWGYHLIKTIVLPMLTTTEDKHFMNQATKVMNGKEHSYQTLLDFTPNTHSQKPKVRPDKLHANTTARGS